VSLPLTVPLQGSALARWMLRRLGWQLKFDGLPRRQGVLIVYPHTSNWDFIYAILAKWGIGIHVTFWGKDTLFRVPLFGRWLRWLGGLPVNRHSASGIVGPMVRELVAARAADRFMWLALSPEGTRSLKSSWRSGFYHVARDAGVPLGLAYLDYGRRVVGIEHFMILSGDMRKDMAQISATYSGVVGKRPAYTTPIQLKP